MKITVETATAQIPFKPPTPFAIANRAFTDKKKEQVISRLFRLWLQHPSMRLMQLVGNIPQDDKYYVEDFELIESLEGHYGSK